MKKPPVAGEYNFGPLPAVVLKPRDTSKQCLPAGTLELDGERVTLSSLPLSSSARIRFEQSSSGKALARAIKRENDYGDHMRAKIAAREKIRNERS